jgi:predicted kinase
METKRVILTRGIQGSGKSTWAKSFVAESPETRVRWNSDDMRNMLGVYMVGNFTSDANKKREKFIGNVFEQWMGLAMAKGYDIVVDNMNLSDRAVNNAKRIVDNFNDSTDEVEYLIEFKDFFISVNECILRDKARPNPIGEKVIRQTWRNFRDKIINIENNKIVDSQFDFELKQKGIKPKCIIADMDATICFNISGRPFFGNGAANKMNEDVPNIGVIENIKTFLETAEPEDRVFIITGRESTDDIVDATEAYINKIFGPNPQVKILFRPIGSMTSGDKCKIQLYKENIEGKYRVLYALEDSAKVVNAYREIGMTVFQVVDGKF